MPDTVIQASHRFPVGTSVTAYSGSASATRNAGRAPFGAVTEVETETVAADGSLTFGDLITGHPYSLYADVDGTPTYLTIVGSA